jgi:hypothetical protein
MTRFCFYVKIQVNHWPTNAKFAPAMIDTTCERGSELLDDLST